MLQTELNIKGRRIANGLNPYIIAEAGSNFNQSLDVARRLIDAAAEAGADAVKFQLFRADKLYPDGGEMYDLFKSVELNADWVPTLITHANDRSLTFLASAFDRASVETLSVAGVDAFKVGSSETTNAPLLYAMASKGKPMIIATAMCDMVDVEEAVTLCLAANNPQVALLQCGARYPLPEEQVNLRVMHGFSARFGCPVGLSDHTLSATAAIASVGLGAAIIEKHFTLDKSAVGPDHSYAVEPPELAALVAGVRSAYSAMGDGIKQMLPEEKEVGRREGLYAAQDIPAGSLITGDHIEVRRPAIGLRARYKDIVLGAKSVTAIQKSEPLTWDKLEL